jgi:hypothetical protein
MDFGLFLKRYVDKIFDEFLAVWLLAWRELQDSIIFNIRNPWSAWLQFPVLGPGGALPFVILNDLLDWLVSLPARFATIGLSAAIETVVDLFPLSPKLNQEVMTLQDAVRLILVETGSWGSDYVRGGAPTATLVRFYTRFKFLTKLREPIKIFTQAFSRGSFITKILVFATDAMSLLLRFGFAVGLLLFYLELWQRLTTPVAARLVFYDKLSQKKSRELLCNSYRRVPIIIKGGE